MKLDPFHFKLNQTNNETGFAVAAWYLIYPVHRQDENLSSIEWFQLSSSPPGSLLTYKSNFHKDLLSSSLRQDNLCPRFAKNY